MAGAQPMQSCIVSDAANFLLELDEIVAGKHIEMSIDVEHEVYEITPQAAEPTDDQKGGLAPLTNCSILSRTSSANSVQNMYDGLKTLHELWDAQLYKPGSQEMSYAQCLVAGPQKQTTLEIKQLDIDNTLRYIQKFKDDRRLSPYTMANVLAKIANTLARHHDEWKYAIKFCSQAHEC